MTGAWAAARLVHAGTGTTRRGLLALLTVFWVVTVWSVGTNANAGRALDASRMLTGPSGMAWQFGQMRNRFQQRPIDTWADENTGYRALARYANACTLSDDRLLVTWFEPIIYFYAERTFAGGRPFFDGGWHDSMRDQQFTIDRLRSQRVPLVLMRDEFELMFRKYFPLVAAHVDTHYLRATPQVNAKAVGGYQVWIDRTRAPVGMYTPLGLPCFR